GSKLRGFAFHDFRFAHHHHRAVIDGVARRARRANDAIKERDVQAEGRTTRERLHQPARSRTVEKQFVAHTHVIGRHDNRQAVVDERDLADKSFIEDRVDQFAIVAAAVRLAANLGSFGWHKVLHRWIAHARRLTGAPAVRQVPIWIPVGVDLRRIDRAPQWCRLWCPAPLGKQGRKLIWPRTRQFLLEKRFNFLSNSAATTRRHGWTRTASGINPPSCSRSASYLRSFPRRC